MFSYDMRVNRVRIDRQFTPEDVTQSRGVEHGAGADDARRGQTGSFRIPVCSVEIATLDPTQPMPMMAIFISR